MSQLKMHLENVPTITSRGGSINILISPQTVGSGQLVLGVSKLAVNEKVKPHVHDYSEEAFYVIEGSGRISFLDTDVIDFKEGDAILVPKGKVHWIENTGDRTMTVVFTVAPLAPQPGVGHREVELKIKEEIY